MRNEIKFWTSSDPGVFAETLSRSLSGDVLVKDWNEYVLIESEAHALALIDALQSAIEQKWFPTPQLPK